MASQPSFRFAPPATALHCGSGVVDMLGDVVAARSLRRVALVLDAWFEGKALPDRLVRLVASAGGESTCLFVAPGEPDTAGVERLRQGLARAAPDLVVAIGGGSTMDAAKVARSTLHRPEPVAELASFDADYGLPKCALICVPTTAGTASEVSAMAVISQPGMAVKLRYRLAHMAAELALLDPELLVSLPAAVTAETGIDALTHALEAFVSLRASPITDALSGHAALALAEALPRAVTEPADIAARQACLVASAMAGVAFNETQLGLVHAISAALGAQAHIRHGLANALVLAEVMGFNAPALPADKSALLARVFADDDPRRGARRMLARLGLRAGLGRFIAPGDVPGLAAASLLSGNIATTPRQPTRADVERILHASLPDLGEEP